MGSAGSQMRDVPLIAQSKPVAAIDPRFCIPTHVQLQEKPHYLHSGLTFIDAQSGGRWFETQNQSMLSRRVTLLDGNQNIVASYRPKTFSLRGTHYVHAGTDHDGDPTFEIWAHYDSGKATMVTALFTDVLTNDKCEIGFIGDWRRRDACFWLDRGRTGNREPVAKIYCPEEVSRKKYYVEVAPNMDIALTVVICAILANLQRSHEKPSE